MKASFFFCAPCSLECNFPYKSFTNFTLMHGQLGLGGMAERSHSNGVKRGLPWNAEAFRESVCTALFQP